MKANKIMGLRLLISILLVIGFSSCSKKSSSKNTSRATGWNMDSKKAGSSKKQQAGPGLVFVEGGTFTMGKVEDDVMHDWNNTPTQQHVQSFYMDETEVTNSMYLDYLDWLKSVYPPTEENYKNIYEGASPDTLVWRNRLGYNETMTNNYLRHPSYAEYPVVGVNWIQAVEFSNWRTQRVNEALLEKNGYLKKNAKTLDVTADSNFDTETYLNSPTLAYGGNEEIVLKGKNGGKKAPKAGKDGKVIEPKNVYAQRSSGILLPEYRLPTEAEWEYAAAADVGQREYNIYKGQKKYPWSGGYTRSGKRQSKGDQLANFKQGNGDYGGIAGWSDDGADITNEVKKYPANDFGLYDMAGNVAEWVQDVYRPIIDNEANDFNYFRGNQYTKNKIGADGKVEIVTKENMKFDTLSNGRIVARKFPGQIAQVPVDEKETYLRQNFDKSDNTNYRDGDKQSTRYYNFGSSEADTEKQKDEKIMYNSPKHNVTTDSLGKMVRKYDKSSKRTTLINDEVRVYKGGSWRDRAYWLDPAQRRYFPQDMATDYIGFRCAMSRVGPKADKKKTARN
ncbi:MAG: gliding motility lipoprotein GldJ [Flavobacterium sp.]|jgi:gliding motility-associated lipoprotein GldJ|uniref:gliding motility lipoprotein GldJ n=1 Tax=unclassified Flavobacterium TaxID=196869 RepID=UPI000C1A7570|nr:MULTISPECIES: gliding motility lipoprotein GldJ [unclassified Flavobacterium]MDP3679267.1 gliding motility lipoprotein GldJ [Flavobacterium sp.]MDZ4331692.1 gliding motility lipoprotein GldJ [Flavobacterium sp.]PIF60831.1 protein involved in gliding motility GldJ [Flavobacterium sp. 11]RKS13173.1 protein involved in gliding motility GldJ [Flavobacterium sp. 120]WKL45216.1 gliding motility lipoprotein GldJ [Flavobacterium sp. ZE23DGlu08]